MEENLGFVCEYNKSSLKTLLDRILKERNNMQDYVENISMFASMYTWEKRCRLVSNTLIGPCS